MLSFWPLLLPLVALLGWFIGRRKGLANQVTRQSSYEYYLGLNYLLNEQPDKAVDIFIKLLEVDKDTVETHLALGSLFRRRGEVERAIRIHQNLIARPQLSHQQRIVALIALGRDYMCGGVLDRSEKIFQEVAQTSNEQCEVALQYLLDIYQQEKFWGKAILIAKKLETVTKESMHQVIAHHHCELGEAALKDRLFNKATHHLNKALSIDHKSVRATLLQAKVAKCEGNYKRAIQCYKRVKLQNPDFLGETIPRMIECSLKQGKDTHYTSYLHETLQEYPRISIVLALAEVMQRTEGVEKALDFVAEHLSHNPSLRGLNKLIEWHINTSYGKVRTKLTVLKDITTKLLKDKPRYRCVHCGFAGSQLHWLCPSCKQWNVVKPILGIEGD